MADQSPKPILVHQGFDERFLRGILTRDISPSEAVFDLIDNSIDAARNALLSGPTAARDAFGLPASYRGYKIALRFTDASIIVSDNCLGIDRASLENDTFIIGKPSRHRLGVGHFGVGLKRALLALGSQYHLKTSRPEFGARMSFSAGDLSLRDEPLSAWETTPRECRRTTVAISNLQPGPAHEFSGGRNLSDLRRMLARRYGLFVRKGLMITVNGRLVESFGPDVRQRGPIRPKKWHSKSGAVEIFVEAGMHAQYRATTESDYNSEVNKSLTDQYGWYIVCNDRIIEVAVTEKRFGFSSAWHPEYNGFLGWLHFVAEDPGALPWNTTKTVIDTNAAVFRSAFVKLEKFSDEYRSENRNLRKGKGSGGGGKGGSAGGGKGSGGTGGGGAGGDKGKKHINDWDELLPPIALGWSDAKLESLLSEAENLDVGYSYSGCALLRMVVERAVDQHIRRSKNLDLVKAMCAAEQEAADRPFTPEQISNFEPTLKNMLDWLKKNSTYFPPEVRSECSQAAGKFSNALSKTVNGAMHKSTLVGEDLLKTIRNEVYPLILFLVQTPPTRP